ncbi:hypothetical protein [Algibacter pacificus]|uniref:hypothetical protein n=1 Tax=Algibacter pacificus TaxID=2599389 RepID=UPI0011CC69B1|nr:hypothetical protein [Algibacter pacificus]
MKPAKQKTLSFFKNQVIFLEEAFVIENIEAFTAFKKAVEMYCYFTFEFDKIIDSEVNFESQYVAKENKTLVAVKSVQSAIQILSSIFPLNHPFWDTLNQALSDYYENTLEEKYQSIKQPLYSLEAFENYAIAKHCLAYIPIAGLNFLFKCNRDYQALRKMYTHIFLAMQMNDDLEDFNDDIENNQWTYLHARVVKFLNTENIEEDKSLTKFKERLLYVSGIGTEAIDYVKLHFNEALLLAKTLSLVKISEWLEDVIADVQENEALVLRLLHK